MITCDEALELISGETDGVLTAEESARLEEHLAHCAQCRALLADFQAMHEALPRLAEEPPAGLADAVMNRVWAEAPDRKKRPRWRSWASLAAVLVLVVVGGQASRLWSAGNGAAGDAPVVNAALVTAGGGAAQQETAAEAPAAEPAAGAEPELRSGGSDAAGASGGDAAASGGGAVESAPYAASISPESAPPGASSALTEEGARAELAAWLALDGGDGVSNAADETALQISLLGYSEDGSAYLFAVTDQAGETSTVYAVPLDGSDIYALPEAEP